MAFDGIAVCCIKDELNELLSEGKIDKILQPEKDEIHLVIRSRGKNNRLILSASSSQPRIHLTENLKENPEKAPMFCMLLRKHISSGKILSIKQPDFERIISIEIESKNEMGDIITKHLIIEIMGRHSNIILTDENNKIAGSIKYIDFSVSTVRQLIPGMIYEMPPSQDKLNPLDSSSEDILNRLKYFEGEYDKFILNNFTGIGPLSAREITYSIFGDINKIAGYDDEKFADEFVLYFKNIKNKSYNPCIIYKENGKVWDFSAIKINQYENMFKITYSETFNYLLDLYYYEKDLKERLSQKSASLNKFIENNIARCTKKIALQKEKLKDSQNKDKYKIKGDLLTANLYRIEEKTESVTVENFYDDMKPIKITLKPELDPSKNAQRYYTLYQKAKNAEVMTTKQLEISNTELEYLKSVKDCLSLAENENDIKEIQLELINEGYNIKSVNSKNKSNKKSKSVVLKPMQFTLSDGHILYVGKNNMQNDELTLKLSSKNDLWFHTKLIHGSHAVIKTNNDEISDDVIVEAAKICSYYSKARDSANVPVDYTTIKNVKKPSGAKPGMVIYFNYKTVNVKPELLFPVN